MTEEIFVYGLEDRGEMPPAPLLPEINYFQAKPRTYLDYLTPLATVQ